MEHRTKYRRDPKDDEKLGERMERAIIPDFCGVPDGGIAECSVVGISREDLDRAIVWNDVDAKRYELAIGN